MPKRNAGHIFSDMVFSLPDTLFSSIAKNPNMGRVRSGTFKGKSLLTIFIITKYLGFKNSSVSKIFRFQKFFGFKNSSDSKIPRIQKCIRFKMPHIQNASHSKMSRIQKCIGFKNASESKCYLDLEHVIACNL